MDISSVDTLENYINGEWQFESAFSEFTEQLEFLSPAIGYYLARASLEEGEQSYYNVEYFTDIISSTENLNNTRNSFAIYPNPAQDFIQINTPNNDATRLDMLDLNGRLCHSEQLQPTNSLVSINISSLNDGVYFMVLNGKNGVKTGKVVVRK